MIEKANKLDMEILLSCMLLVIVYNIFRHNDTIEHMLALASVSLLVTISIVYIMKITFKIGNREGIGALAIYSFPSFHTAIAFTLAITASYFNWYLVPLYLSLACIIAVARIKDNYHNKSEVLVGGFIGSIIAIICYDINIWYYIDWYIVIGFISFSLIIIIFNSYRRN